MSTSTLLEVPKDERAWSRFSWSNKVACQEIRQAIQKKFNVNLTEYFLDPIDLKNPQYFLEANSQTHIDFNNVLKLQGADLEEVDVKNPRQLESWIYLNWKELFDAKQALAG